MTPDQIMEAQRIRLIASELRTAALEHDLHFLGYLLDMAAFEADRLCRTARNDVED